MIRRVVIASHELGFLYRDASFAHLLEPGVHWLLGWRPIEVRRVSRLEGRVDLSDVELLVQRDEVAEVVEVFRIADTERGLLFRDGIFDGFLEPGVHVYLRGSVHFEVEKVDIAEPRLEHRLAGVLASHATASAYLDEVHVTEGQRAILWVDGVKEAALGPGRHFYWRGLKDVRHRVLDLREQTLEVQGQELMTADKVSLRVNLSVRYRVADPEAAVTTQASYHDALYRDVQLALRDEIGGHPLDELLSRKEDVGKAVASRVQEGTEAYGVRVESAGLRDVILPGEMRTILNQVIEAEKKAQANMITRREETAATRSLLNTAKLLEKNPLLLHLKELESVERIAERVQSLSVHGGLEGLMQALGGMVRGDAAGRARLTEGRSEEEDAPGE